MSSSTSPEKLPQTAVAATAPSSKARASGAPQKSVTPREYDLLMKTVFAFVVIVAGLAVFFTWTGYSHQYAQVTEGWHLGQTKLIEVTVVKEDKGRLACASDVVLDGIHCGTHTNGTPFEGGTQDDPHVLSPYNTIKNELFLASGLWTSPALTAAPLPTERFTVACNYKITGVLKSVGLRWAVNAAFEPVKQSVTVGTLTDCVIPK